VGAPVNTGPDGSFRFAALTLPQATQVRVATADGSVVSEAVSVRVALRVTTKVSPSRVKRHRRVRFSGTVRPARDRATYAIQKLNRRGVWVRVAGGRLAHRSAKFSGFVRHIRVNSGGRYRVYVRVTGGAYTSGVGRETRIRTLR
jgi:hypothetical protein